MSKKADKVKPAAVDSIPLQKIKVVWEDNPRGQDWYDNDEYEHLKNSILDGQSQGYMHGIKSAVTIRTLADDEKVEGESYDYKLVSGYRRFRAMLDLSEVKEKRKDRRDYPWAAKIPAVIKDVTGVEADVRISGELADALIENIQREQMPALSEAKALKQLIDAHGYSRKQLADALRKSPGFITQRLQLLDFSDEIQERAEELDLSPTVMRQVGRLDDEEKQSELIDKIAADEMSAAEVKDYVDARVTKSNRGRPKKETEEEPEDTTEEEEEETAESVDEEEEEGTTAAAENIEVAVIVEDDEDEETEDAEEETEETEEEAGDVDPVFAALEKMSTATSRPTAKVFFIAIREWEKYRNGNDSFLDKSLTAEALHDWARAEIAKL